MASLLLKKGRYSLQFTPRSEPRRQGELKPAHPRRLSVALGEIDETEARRIQKHVEELVKSQGKREPGGATAKWRDFIAEHDDGLYRSLLRVGLVPERLQDQQAAAAVEAERPNTLEKFVTDYIRRRGDVKPGTATFYGHTKRCLVEFFGATRPLGKITPSETDDWRRWLGSKQDGGQGLSSNTVARRCGMAKQFFRDALRRRLIAENPFDGMKGCMVKGNAAREYFITRDEAAAVLNACPDWQWRLIFALSRFGGMRCPSEHMGLRWIDVDLLGGKFKPTPAMLVHSPKTEHHDGKESRVVPIFPELRPYLEEAWEQAEEGEVYVIPGAHHRLKGNPTNLGTQLARIIRSAGLKPWPKLFQNLRATRETELAETFPIQVVCEWIGNSQAVAKRHYLQTTEEHFARATTAETGLQNGLHFSDATPCNAVHKKRETPGNAGVCTGMQSIAPPTVGVTGFEPVTSTV